MNMDTLIDLKQVASDVLVEFFEVAFHSILYVREIYPAGIFERRRKYNVPVQMSCHPEVNDYICQMLTSMKPLLLSGKVERVTMVVLSPTQEPVERFSFEIASSMDGPSKIKEDALLLRLEQSLRSFLLKLNTCDALLHPCPQDCTWSVHLYTTDSAVVDLQQALQIDDFNWIEADESLTSLAEPNLLPLKAMDSPVFKMQMFVEESGTKS